MRFKILLDYIVFFIWLLVYSCLVVKVELFIIGIFYIWYYVKLFLRENKKCSFV